MIITTEQAQGKAARGAKMLDKTWPGWHEIVNPETLNMATGQLDWHGCGCVATQLAAIVSSSRDEQTYLAGMVEIQRRRGEKIRNAGFLNRVASYFGFLLSGMEADYDEHMASYRLLTEAWQDEIQARR